MTTPAPTVVVPPQPADRSICMACDHRSADHDKTASRYCNATVAHALTRLCICVVSPA